MRMRAIGVWSSFLTVGGLAVALAAPAEAGEIYSWRTEDGGYAFADDLDAVPERYRAEARGQKADSISEYRRYTAQDDAAASRYERQLAARLERLRQLNGAAPPSNTAVQPQKAAPAPDYVTVRTGSQGGGGVDISTPTGADDLPLETERIYMRRKGGAVVQPVLVTRRGNKIVSITKPRNREWDAADVVDEDDLLRYLER